ncbi:MAG: two-component sensor histidine kinase, partial [Methylobacterium sp.]|nr:two-component sensor histidine kinase [Methylobacterium sp.]
GFPPDVLLRAGDPYLTDGASETRAGGGLGLGLFIAKTLLERGGASIEFSNLPAPATGACVRMIWLREAFEIEVPPAGPNKAEPAILHRVGS